MPYVKRVKRFNKDNVHIRTDCYLAEQIMVGNARTENIIRKLTTEQALAYTDNTERNQDQDTEHTEQHNIEILREGAQAYKEIFAWLYNNEDYRPALALVMKTFPDKVQTIKKMEAVL